METAYYPSFKCFTNASNPIVCSEHGGSPIHMVPSIRLLEDEIHRLRHRMEQIYLQETDFTSEKVIEISRKLDLKINEYMEVKRKLHVG